MTPATCEGGVVKRAGELRRAGGRIPSPRRGAGLPSAECVRLFVSGAALVALASRGSSSPVIGCRRRPDLTGRSYVALGDSYAAAWGCPSRRPSPRRVRPVRPEYPHLLAAHFGFSLTDRSCGGAVIANVVDTRRPSPAEPPRRSRLPDADTALVTLTIGGNDLGFWNIRSDVRRALGGGSGGRQHRRADARDVPGAVRRGHAAGARQHARDAGRPDRRPRVESAVAAIQTRAPNAKIVVIGYPALAPDPAHTPSAGCYSGLFQGLGFRANAYPYTDVDVALLTRHPVVPRRRHGRGDTSGGSDLRLAPR